MRNYDVLMYRLASPVEGASLGLAVFLDDQLAPLCNRESGSSEFFIDQTQQPLSASQLKESNRILRIVSSDRRGQDCFLIDEYISSDVHIPIVSPDAQIISTSTVTADDVDAKISARLQEILRLLSEKEKSKASPPIEKRTKVATPNAPQAIGPYSQAVAADGFLYVSGCIGFDPATMKLKGEGVEEQAVQALDNLKAILEAAGCSLSSVCKTTVLLRDMSSYPVINSIYAKYFVGDILPARTAFAVSDLPGNALVEIDAIAVL